MKKWTFILIGAMVGFFISSAVLDALFIPDPCYFHTHDTNFIMDLFYNTNSGNNFHPEPNVVYLLTTIGVGGVLGFIMYNISHKKNVPS